MVRLGSPGNPSAQWPLEVVRISLPSGSWSSAFLDAVSKCRAVAIGPGLGTHPDSQSEIRAVIATCPLPMVVDADGLTALGSIDDAEKLLAQRSAATVLTPHDGEYARLAGAPPGPDRVAAARRLAAEVGCTVLLKGSLTAVASPTAPSPTSATQWLRHAGPGHRRYR